MASVRHRPLTRFGQDSQSTGFPPIMPPSLNRDRPPEHPPELGPDGAYEHRVVVILGPPQRSGQGRPPVPAPARLDEGALDVGGAAGRVPPGATPAASSRRWSPGSAPCSAWTGSKTDWDEMARRYLRALEVAAPQVVAQWALDRHVRRRARS